jgi:glycine cleavage system H protein
MSGYLETTSDKFTFRVATDRLYSPEGSWVQPEGSSRVRIGITDFVQQRSGDVTFLTVKAPGTKVQVGEGFADLETVKVTQAIFTPVAGTIVEINKALDLTPEVVNKDPYGEGWLAVIEPGDWEADRAKLLDAQAYLSVMRSQIEEEIQRP